MIRKGLFVGLLLTGFLAQFCDHSSTEPNGPGEVSKPSVNKIAFNDVQHVLGEDYALCIMNPDGSDLTKIGPGIECFDPFTWSYDAARIVYGNVTNTSTVSIDGREALGNYSQINYVTLDNMENVTLDIYGESPVFSHDHSKIAFELRLERNQNILLMVYDLITKETNTIINIDASDVYDVYWSDDDKQLYYKKIQAFHPEEYFCSVGLNDNEEQILEVTDTRSGGHESWVDISDFERDESANSDADSVLLSYQSPDYKKGFGVNVIIDPTTFRTTLHMFLYDLDKKTEKLITTDTNLYPGAISWAPTSEKFVYFIVGKGFIVYDLESDAKSTILEVVENIPVYMDISWSPN